MKEISIQKEIQTNLIPAGNQQSIINSYLIKYWTIIKKLVTYVSRVRSETKGRSGIPIKTQEGEVHQWQCAGREITSLILPWRSTVEDFLSIDNRADWNSHMTKRWSFHIQIFSLPMVCETKLEIIFLMRKFCLLIRFYIEMKVFIETRVIIKVRAVTSDQASFLLNEKYYI